MVLVHLVVVACVEASYLVAYHDEVVVVLFVDLNDEDVVTLYHFLLVVVVVAVVVVVVKVTLHVIEDYSVTFDCVLVVSYYEVVVLVVVQNLAFVDLDVEKCLVEDMNSSFGQGLVQDLTVDVVTSY